MRVPTPDGHKLRLVVIGLGIAGQSHLLDAVTSDGVEVVAVCARRADHARNVASDFGIKGVYTDVEDMLARERPDCAVVATPPSLLASHVCACIRAGGDVLAEKPLATKRSEVDAMRSLLHQSTHRLVVPYTRRYRASWIAAREWVQGGALGNLIGVECLWKGPYSERYHRDGPTYRSDPDQRVAGVLLDSGSHALDAVLFLTGDLGLVRSASLELDATRSVDIAANVVLRQASGTNIVLDFEDGHGNELQSVHVIGTQGRIVVTNTEARATFSDGSCQQITDRYVKRPVDDLIALRTGAPICGAQLVEADRVVSCLTELYAHAGRPLFRRWHRPRAKAFAHLSGGC